jgi:hypothetical protein
MKKKKFGENETTVLCTCRKSMNRRVKIENKKRQKENAIEQMNRVMIVELIKE